MAARLLLLAAAAAVAVADSSRCFFQVAGPNGDPEFYDLSSLATSDPWQVLDVSDSKSKAGVLFLSVCGPLHGLTKAQCPDPDASACLARQDRGQWRTVVASAASASQNASMAYNGGSSRLTLTLPGHSGCDAKRNFSVQVHMVCNKDQVAAPFFVALSGCVIELAWITSAACPVGEGARACSYPGPNGHWFDLYPLATKTAYQVTSTSGRLYYLNLCTPVADGLCPGEAAVACEANSTVALGRFVANSGLQPATEGLVSRQKGDNDSMVEIHYLCNQKAPLTPKPELLSASNGHAVFRVETPYACSAIPIDCVAYSKEGNKIDLSSLRKANSHWTLRDPRPNKTHLNYYINVCGPLARNLPSPCHAGNIGVCVSSSKPGEETVPLGTVEHPPRFTKDKELILTYRDGAMCPDGKNKRKVHLSFICDQIEHGPMLDVVSEDCVYSFLWRTPAACTAKPDRGDNCVVLDSRMLLAFNLKEIYNNIEDYKENVDGSLFRINLCGALHKTCNGHDNVSVCLSKNGKEFAIGMRNETLEYMDGRLSLHLTGEECLTGVPSSVTVILACEHLDPDGPKTQPQVFPSGVNDCRFFIVWNHHRACPPYKEVPCSVRAEDGTFYDLSALSRRASNHLAVTRNGQSSGVFINVCRSVVFNRDSACEVTSGACLRQGDRFINLGDVQAGPYIESNVLKLRYDEGALCHAPRGPVHVSTTITFRCDYNALESEPVYVGEYECDHALFWQTAAACPLREPSGSNCSVTNPYTKFRFDLSGLADQDHIAVDEYGHHLVLAVCSNVSDVSCPRGAGACQMDAHNGLSLGKPSSDLKYLPGDTLELRYEGGSACGIGRKRETVIEFFCGAKGSPEGPRVVEEMEGCVTIIHWHTRLACEDPISCSTTLLDHQMDLSSLIRVSQNYRVDLPDKRVFFLNVCRPLLPQTGLNCGASAASCMARKVSGTLIEDLNLGYATSAPTVTSDGALLIYSNGSPCPRRPSVNATTIISFKCNPLLGAGSPKLEKETTDCQYFFSWQTSKVCGPSEEKVGDCKVYSSQLRRFISLEHLDKEVKVGKYTVDLCVRGTDCGGNSVCSTSSDGSWVSYGVLQKALLHVDYLKLHFGGGASCTQNKTYGAEVWLKCDNSNGTGIPRVLLEHPCYAIFEWRTDAVCLQRANEPDDTVGKIEEQNVTESHTSTTLVLLVIGVCCLSVGAATVVFVRRRYPLMCINWRPFPWPSSSSHTQVHYSRETLSTTY